MIAPIKRSNSSYFCDFNGGVYLLEAAGFTGSGRLRYGSAKEASKFQASGGYLSYFTISGFISFFYGTLVGGLVVLLATGTVTSRVLGGLAATGYVSQGFGYAVETSSGFIDMIVVRLECKP